MEKTKTQEGMCGGFLLAGALPGYVGPLALIFKVT